MLTLDLQLPRRGMTIDAQFVVAPGRTLAITGPSGSGKSSLLRAIAGLERSARGRLRVGDGVWLDSAGRVDMAPERRGCGMVFQDGALFPHLSVWRNVAYGLPRRAGRERAMEQLDQLAISHLADARPAAISGGERRRVALARALAPGPRVLLLDEPLTGLDARTAAATTRLLAGVLGAAAGPSIIVTHDFEQASVLADEVAVIDAGRIVQQGTADQLVSAPATAFVAELTGAAVLRGTGAPAGDGLTAVTLAGGAVVFSAGSFSGPVAVVVRPWDVTLEPPGPAGLSSARNRLAARVSAITPLGGRARVALALPAPLVAEVTTDAVERLGLVSGSAVTAVWKATATRLVPLATEEGTT